MIPELPNRTFPNPPARRLAAVRVALIYVIFAAVWIAVSDRLLGVLFADAALVAALGMLKGFLFVGITGLLVYALVRVHDHRLRGAEENQGRAEDAVAQADAQIRWLGDNLPGSYLFQFTRDADGRPRFLHVGAAVEKIHQLSPEAVLRDPDTLYAQIAPEYRAAMAEGERNSGSDLSDADVLFRFARSDGEYRWLHIRSRPRRTAGGVIWDGLATDVTEAKRAEDALRESEERLRLLVMMLPDALFLNQDNAITFVNQSGLALWRAERPEQVLGKSPFDFVHPDDHEQLRTRIQRLVASGQIAPLWECRMRALDGTIIMVETTAVLFAQGSRPVIQVVARDITARKRAESALREHEAILQETGRIAQVGGWSLDLKNGGGYLTAEIARIVEHGAPDELTWKTMCGYLTTESRIRLDAAMASAVEQAASYDLELELVSARGTPKWIRAIGHPVLEEGKVVRLQGSVQDISERRRLDEERAREQRRMGLLADISRRLVINDSPRELLSGIFSDLSRELEVDVYANYMVREDGHGLKLESSGGLTPAQQVDFAEPEFGVSLCGLVAQTRKRLVFADLPSVTVPQAAGIIALGVKAYAGHPLIAGNRLIGTISFGSRRRESYSPEDVRLMKAVADQVAAALDRSRLVLELRKGEERFREVVESIDEVFWQTDVNKTHVMYVSPGFDVIWGRPGAAVTASIQTWVDSIHPSDRPRVMEAARTKQKEGKYHETYRILRPDGAIRWIRDRAFPVKDASGQVTRIVGVAEDVTAQRELEAKFLRAQRVEAIGTLAGGVAHDLNNILSPVLMISGLLKDRLTAREDQKAVEILEMSARRGAAIIRQLLTFSRGADGEKLIMQPRHLLKEMIALMKETFPRDLAIGDRVSPDLWTVEGDPTQLHQVLMNLCVNARDAMPQGGQLWVAAENVELRADDPSLQPGAAAGAYVLITISDTGEGIPEENLERIFDPFFTTKPIGQGTGLGLATVLGIVKGHAGFVNVKSERGRGTSFAVYLPAAAPTGELPRSEARAAPAQGKGETVLVVDDEPNVATSIRLLLERNNYRVLLAANGREALATVVEQRDAVRLVLTDTMMPVMGGTALARSLRTIRPNLRILVMTGQDLNGSRAELAGLRIPEVLLKPIHGDQLLRSIRTSLDAGQT